MTRDLTFPNGIGLSPDGRTLYIGISDPENPYIMAYDVPADGKFGKGRVFVDGRARVQQKLQGGFDGLKVDASGNVWSPPARAASSSSHPTASTSARSCRATSWPTARSATTARRST